MAATPPDMDATQQLLSSLLHAERLPLGLQRRGLHPLVLSALTTMGAVALLGWSKGATMGDAFVSTDRPLSSVLRSVPD